MSLPSGITVTLGSFTFPMPPQLISLNQDGYFVEHEIPGMFNSDLADYMGAKQKMITLRGILASGADADMRTLLSSGMLMSSQAFTITSAFSGVYFVSGTVLIKEASFNVQAGTSYPKYFYTITLENFRPGSERIVPEAYARFNPPPLLIIESGADGQSIASGLPAPIIPPYEDATLKIGAPELDSPTIARSGGTP